MVGSSKLLRVIGMFSVCWATCTWLFVAYPFQNDITNAIVMDQNSFQPPVLDKQWQQRLQTPEKAAAAAAEKDSVVIDNDDAPSNFSACLLIMDDNHYLIEWLAYHYHALPLRRLIVGVDPRSETTPTPVLNRWRDMMDITEWQDEDYMSESEVMEAERIVRGNFGNLTASLIRHRARQRVFYYKCMKQLKQEGQTWTMMTDTDEFLRINVKTARELYNNQQHQATIPSARISGSVRSMLQAELQRPGTNWTKSPCVQIPRLRFGSVESGKAPKTMIPDGYQTNQFLTLRWRKHAGPHYFWANKISKVIIDVSRVQWEELRPVESIHRPIKSLCSHRNLHVRAPSSVLAINHYLGSWEQYEYRNDARITDSRFGQHRSRKQYNKDKAVETGTNDDIRPWLQGFVETMGESKAHFLLDQIGVLQPKDDNKTIAFMPKPANDKERCAILFFGLPRSFKDLVLPSVQKNIIDSNVRYNCDYFVHYYYRTEEPSGRANNGGKLDPTEILLLEQAVRNEFNQSRMRRKVHNNEPVVEFVADTEDNFWAARNATIQKYRNTKAKDGKYLYFPWKAKSYAYPSSLDNIVRQWHSINGVWELMERSAAKRGIQYTRVGMFRSDVLYVTPIDIYETEYGGYDTSNNQAMLAPFGAMPVNDRMFYGPYEGVEIWATKRFTFLEEYVHRCEPGWAMHSEKFLNGAIMPAIRELGIAVVVNPDICFLRTRADYSAVTTDCHLLGETRGFVFGRMRSKVEQVLERKCSTPYKITLSHIAVKCEPLQANNTTNITEATPAVA